MKDYEFSIYVINGYGTLIIEAEDEDSAYDKLYNFIDEKMREAELTIDYEVELENSDEDDEWND